MKTHNQIEKPVRLELSQYLLVDLALLGTFGCLLLLLLYAIAARIYFPDVWWLYSWKPF